VAGSAQAAGDDEAGAQVGEGRAASEAALAGEGATAGAKGRRRARKPLTWLRQVSFRGRVSILVAAAVALAVALAALSSYVAVSRQMEQQANANLQNAVQDVSQNVDNYVHLVPTGLNSSQLLAEPLVRLQLQTGYQVQVIANTTSGVSSYAVVPNSLNPIVQEQFFRVTRADRQTFESPQGTESPLQSQQGKDGSPYRVATVSVLQGSLAIMLGYNLSNIDNTLGFLRLILILVALGGVALAATLGWAVGRASMRPVEDLTLAAEHVAKTQDLSEKIEDTSNDELGRLARSFNAMLAALSVSKQQQAQLVSDAGHELRTPLTSLRTNIEVLMRNKDLPPADRDELLADVDAQLQELATLVGDLVDLARDEERPQAEPELVALDAIVAHAVERAKRRAMSVRFHADLQPGEVRAQPALLERAVVNVLDNAAKWSPPDGRVDVRLRANEAERAWHLTVKDEGPGISPHDLPYIFDRFYRAASARSMPGSGLGLAIVKKVVASHAGTVEVTCPPEGGTLVEITLPLADDSPSGASNGSAGDGQPSGLVESNGEVGDFEAAAAWGAGGAHQDLANGPPAAPEPDERPFEVIGHNGDA
jgi:two-component system sensor histidine kinase MprB